MKNALINISGHALSQESVKELSDHFSVIETIPVDAVDFSQDIVPQIRKMLSSVKTPLDGTIPLTLIVPGHSTLASVLLVYLHGLLGHYPSILLLQSDSNGRYKPTNLFHINPAQLRADARKWRQEIIRRGVDPTGSGNMSGQA